MKLKGAFLISLFLIIQLAVGQTLKGVVLDANTKTPIETASVYFDNTTLGTITDENGEFLITYSNAIKSSLVISFLGYKTKIITDYREKNNITVLLQENPEALGEVVINADDGMSRRQKLKLFRREFLGTSKFGKSCTILNEDEIIIRYNKKKRLLTAYSKSPLKIKNKALQYLISYDVTAFNLSLYHFNFDPFQTKSVGFFGTTFYKDLTVFDKQKASKNRAKAYEGSRLQFMRALYAGKLEENGFKTYDGSKNVDPWDYFEIERKQNSNIKRVYLYIPLNILYGKWEKSSMEFVDFSIFIDSYGNYNHVNKVLFSGEMGEQRVGELLPFNYGLKLKQ